MLQSVEKPARYTGGELNAIRKNPADAGIRFAFCFPDVYEVGMSHLGMRILYGLLNEREDTYCERVFAPWPDMDAEMRAKGIPLFALETRDPVGEFDFMGFTLQYEMSYTNVLNMLNLKYVIYNKQAPPLINPYNNGNAWFVQNIRVAADANEEMKMLGEIDTKRELVIDKSLVSNLPSSVTSDSTAKISLKSYAPNHLVYSVNTPTDQVAVFSEIFYDKGWKATINGSEVPYTRVNYLLRGMPLKAGTYDLEFRFDPDSYKTGNLIALISSILLLLVIAGYLYFVFRKRKDSVETT